MYDELTEVDIKKMQEEIDHRTLVLRPKLIEDVKTAREFGDLSENSEYDAAKNKESQLEQKILEYEERIKNAILKMEEESRKGNNVDIPWLAEQCNMSQTYFRRLFHDLYGVSPKQYILSVRLRWAKTMLKSTGDSVTEIAKSCGFDNVYYFSRAFRIHEGVSPSEYRKHHSEMGEREIG